jgi:hypothetical protein
MGGWSGVRGKGQGISFLRGLVGHQGEECVPWPMSRNHNGHGSCGYNGKLHLAHRLMCELEHGQAPEGHEAAHSCGNGHEGCVNPRHLSWKTRAENQHDRYVHKRKPHRSKRLKLTPEAVAEIRALAGSVTNKDLAARFGVSRGNIRQVILRQTWKTGEAGKGGFAVHPRRSHHI